MLETPQTTEVEEIPELEWIGRIVSLMDDKFKIPGLNIRFGLDPILGLIPFAGDIVSLLISSLMIVAMFRHGISGSVIARMLFNVALDFLLSSIPIIGDATDVVIKANRRNYRLLHEHYHERKHQGNGWGIVLLVVLVIVAMIVLVIWGAVMFASWLLGMMGSLFA